MIKIMLVDDMPIFLEYLRGCISWGSYGFEICCEANDGKEALEKFPKYYPDIVLTDITMPYINGLELAEEIGKLYPDTSVVLITAHDEFDYARKALKIGVYDYIVKPFEKEELVLCLLKLQDNISKALELQDGRDNLSQDKKEGILRKFLFEDMDSGVLEEAGISFPGDYFLIYTTKIMLNDDTLSMEKIYNWEEIIIHMIENMLELNGSFEVFRDYENNIVTILNFSDKREMEKYKGYEFQDIIKMINHYLNFNAKTGVSGFCSGRTVIKEGYYQTLFILNSQGQNSVSHLLDYKKHRMKGGDVHYPWKAMEQVSNSLQEKNLDEINRILEEEVFPLFDGLETQQEMMLYQSLLNVLVTFILKAGRNLEDVLGQETSPYAALKGYENREEKQEYIMLCYGKAVEYQRRNVDNKSHIVASMARNYMEQNYGNAKLSVSDISREILVNQTYLRKMFKSETGFTINEYLTQLRMKKAKNMILEGRYKIAVIAEKTGYSDVSYFSKCFKKYYGFSPKQLVKELK